MRSPRHFTRKQAIISSANLSSACAGPHVTGGSNSGAGPAALLDARTRTGEGFDGQLRCRRSRSTGVGRVPIPTIVSDPVGRCERRAFRPGGRGRAGRRSTRSRPSHVRTHGRKAVAQSLIESSQLVAEPHSWSHYNVEHDSRGPLIVDASRG